MMAMIGGIMRGKEPNVSVSLSKGWELGTLECKNGPFRCSLRFARKRPTENARQGSQTKTFVMTLL